MRLLLDEMLSSVIADRLRAHGHDIEVINEALSDQEVMDLARSERRAVVTNNLVDFRPLHHDAIAPGGPGHFGIVFMPGNFRRTRADVGRIVSALQVKLDEYPGESDLADGETWLG